MSNVMDGQVGLQDAHESQDVFVMKGIARQTDVGYLTILESSRLCQVLRSL